MFIVYYVPDVVLGSEKYNFKNEESKRNMIYTFMGHSEGDISIWKNWAYKC